MQMGPMSVDMYGDFEKLLHSLKINDAVAIEMTPTGVCCTSVFRLSRSIKKRDKQFQRIMEWAKATGFPIVIAGEDGRLLTGDEAIEVLTAMQAKKAA